MVEVNDFKLSLDAIRAILVNEIRSIDLQLPVCYLFISYLRALQQMSLTNFQEMNGSYFFCSFILALE